MDDRLLRTFRFQVKLRKSSNTESGIAGTADAPNAPATGATLCDAGFQECTGLDLEMDVQQYEEGGRNDGVIQRVGRAKYTNIVLKRGMVYSDRGQVNRDLWQWIQGILAGERPVARYDGVIQVFSQGETVVATWVFDRGLPSKITGPQLNAKTGEVAIEQLHIAHEGLRLVES